MTSFTLLPPATGLLAAARPGPDLAASGFTEHEYRAAGSAVRYSGPEVPFDGVVDAVTGASADFATRVAVRRPAEAGFSGTVLVEWLNVSSGDDVAPEYTYLAEEIVRQGHVWVGVSAQHVGVEGGVSAVGIGDQAPSGLRHRDPARYGDLHHPGDAYCYGIFDAVARALTGSGGPLDGWTVRTLLAVGESQSAFALTTYVNAVQPLTGTFDGFLIHSRGGAATGWGDAARGFDVGTVLDGAPVRLRTDADAKIVVVQAETDLVSPRLHYVPARQDDAETLRLWEIAGSAHADRWQIGEFEELLGCPDPVNRGQQVFVLRAALRSLTTWCRGGDAPPPAARLDLDPASATGFACDDLGNTTGGVRTPAVDVAVEILSGVAAEGVSLLCALFGRTLPIPPSVLIARYGTAENYLAAYADATDAAIRAGFVLPEDRDAVLADARPDLLAR